MTKNIEFKPSNKDREMIVHEYKIRVENSYYMCIVFGSKYKAEQFIRKDWKASEIHWIKSFIWNKSIVMKMGRRNRTYFQDGFFLRLQYLHQWYGYTDKDCPDVSEGENVKAFSKSKDFKDPVTKNYFGEYNTQKNDFDMIGE